MNSIRVIQGLGKAFAGYLAWLGQRARDQNAKCIWFLSREGRWFSHRYEEMRLRCKDPEQYPPAHHLPVSRLSTFLPSLTKIDEMNLAPLLQQYGNQTTGAILGSLGFFHSAPRSLIESLMREGILQQPWHEAGKFVLAREDVQVCLEKRRKQQQKNLLTFLAKKGIDKNKKDIFVADIGWRGSIQDNLARLLPEVNFVGFYFHLQPFLSNQLTNTKKIAYLNEENIRSIKNLSRRLRFAAPLEFAIMDYKNGAIIGYEFIEGSIKEITSFNILPINSNELLLTQEAINKEIANYNLNYNLNQETSVHYVLNYLERPSNDIINIFFSTPRDDFFGTGNIIIGADRIYYREIFKAIFNKNARMNLAKALSESHWPWALLWRDVPFFAPILIKVIQLFDIRLMSVKK